VLELVVQEEEALVDAGVELLVVENLVDELVGHAMVFPKPFLQLQPLSLLSPLAVAVVALPFGFVVLVGMELLEKYCFTFSSLSSHKTKKSKFYHPLARFRLTLVRLFGTSSTSLASY